MIIRYQIFKEKRLEVHKFIGDWVTSQFAAFLSELKQELDFGSVEKILVDFREANLQPLVHDLDLVIQLRIENLCKNFSIVHLVDKPSSTALAHLFQDKLTKRGYFYEYCSTMDYALQILGLNETAAEMEEILKNLTHQLV